MRAELRRLFRWLKEKQVSTIVTGEAGNGTLTRQGLEEYVSDCVIVLDHRISGQLSTRRLRVAKYRGSPHGTNEYPFIIDENGISMQPITTVGLTAKASNERISSGIKDLDEMLGGKGYYRGSTVLISGDSGTGKTSVAMEFVSSACQRGEKTLYIATEESESQLARNMSSIGINLCPFLEKGTLHVHAMRATTAGMEAHLNKIHQLLDEYQPKVMVVDPITSFTAIGGAVDAKSMMARVIDYAKLKGITTLLTDLLKEGGRAAPEESVTSFMDTWITLQRMEANGENNRTLYVMKSRGMNHSNQIREFVITDDGIKLIRPYIGPGGVLTGTARYAQEAKDRAEAVKATIELQGLQQELGRLDGGLRAQIDEARSGYKLKQANLVKKIEQLEAMASQVTKDESQMERSRGDDLRAGRAARRKEPA